MKARQNWLVLVVFLVIVSLFLVACERPLPGGYNDPDAGSDTTAPDVPESVPEVVPEAYPAGSEPPAPVESQSVDEEAYPAADAVPVEGDTAGEEAAVDPGLTADGEAAVEEAVPEAGEAADAAPAEEAPVTGEAAADEEASTVESDADEADETPGSHTVAAGENLYRIGLLYGISWLDLAEANGIVDPAGLSVGQVLVIPGAESAAEETADVAETEAPAEAVEVPAPEESAPAEDAAPAEEAAPEEETADTTEEEDAGRPAVYVVQQGDSLYSIGLALGINWAEIVAANGIIGEQIYPGQELIIPALTEDEAAEAEVVDAPVEQAAYVVQEGDSVYSVAFEHSIPWTALIEANGIEAPFTLEVGQSLVIPAGE